MPREKSFAALPTWSAVSAVAGGDQRLAVHRFGCPMEGDVPQADRAALDAALRRPRRARPDDLRHHRHGASGAGERACALRSERFPHLQLTLHFHNTRGMGLANVLAAVQAGIDRFDGSLGGLGGCPYAPGASGNISSEDAGAHAGGMGYDTGMTWRLLDVARQMPAIVGHEVPGQVAKAGRITDLHGGHRRMWRN
jgi:hydroxymethylglutaryl-CoA lyase